MLSLTNWSEWARTTASKAGWPGGTPAPVGCLGRPGSMGRDERDKGFFFILLFFFSKKKNKKNYANLAELFCYDSKMQMGRSGKPGDRKGTTGPTQTTKWRQKGK